MKERRGTRVHARNELLNLPSRKRSQMSIFIIIGIVLVVLIILFIVFRAQIPQKILSTTPENPQSYMDSCVSNLIQDSIKKISSQGGYVNPEIYYEFDSVKRAYICYNANYYYPCVTQEPMYLRRLESEIKKDIGGNVKSCFDNLRKNMENKGYTVNLDYRDFNVSLIPGRVVISANVDMTYSKGDESKIKKGFETDVASKFHDVGVVVQEIASQEAKFCNFEYVGFQMYYPNFNIDKYVTGEDIKIYSVEDRNTKEKIVFAIRSCVLPPGL